MSGAELAAGAGEAAEDHVRCPRLQQGLPDGLLRPGQGPDQGGRRETQLPREKVRLCNARARAWIKMGSRKIRLRENVRDLLLPVQGPGVTLNRKAAGSASPEGQGSGSDGVTVRVEQTGSCLRGS